MLSPLWFTLAFGICSSAMVLAQNPLLDPSKAPDNTSVAAPKPVALSPERRADILMARKMYREAAETYKEAPLDSPVIQNKIGIAYHQMIQTDVAKKYYERAMRLDAKYPEAINNLGTIYYSKKNYRHAVKLYSKA